MLAWPECVPLPQSIAEPAGEPSTDEPGLVQDFNTFRDRLNEACNSGWQPKDIEDVARVSYRLFQICQDNHIGTDEHLSFAWRSAHDIGSGFEIDSMLGIRSEVLA